MKKTLSLGFLCALSGCNLGPPHSVPYVDTSTHWQVQEETEVFSSENPLALGELFNDALLKDYLKALLLQNPDARIASLKVCEAFALRQMSAAKLYPFIDGRVAYFAAKPAGGILQADGVDAIGIPLNIKQQTFIADFDAIWEIDLFGRNQREMESAIAFVEMERASYDSLLISLSAEFTRTYLELRRAQNNLALLSEQVQLLQEKKERIQERLAYGLDAALEVLNIEVLIDNLSLEIFYNEGEMRSFMYRLAVFLGKTPTALMADLQENAHIPQIKERIPLGFPSELLRRRPDISYAEKQAAQATADLGVSIADLFPKLSLRGNLGFENLHLGNTRGSGESFGFGGNFLTPLFHGGSLKAHVQKNQCIRQQTLINYEAVVLRALEESESAIMRFFKSKQMDEKKRSAYAKEEMLFNHMHARYQHGLANHVQLIDSKLSLLKEQKEHINAQIDSEIKLVALYKALGGSF